MLQWLKKRPDAAAPLRPRAWELPYAAVAAKKKKKKKKKKSHENFNVFTTLEFYLVEMILLLLLNLPTASCYIYLNSVEIDKPEKPENY